MKKRKLGVTYNVFCGEELLRDSILSIRNQVDYINIVWQEYSWTGEKASNNLEKVLLALKEEGLVDNILKYDFCFTENRNEANRIRCKKGNMGINDLRRAGCTHGMMMDVDEFYREDEFAAAKEYVYQNNITHSVCSIYDYRILPIYRQIEADDYCVSFIFKLSFLSKIIGSNRFNRMPCRIDSHKTFPLLPIVHKFYYLNNVSMHHMTGVRKNYELKLRSTLTNFSKGGGEVIERYRSLQNSMENMSEEDILSSGYIKVEDEFGILQKWGE